MNFPESFPSLSLEELTLREISLNDLDVLIDLMNFDNQNLTIEEVKGKVVKTELDFKNKTGITWGIEKDGNLIGTCGYYRGFEDKIGEIGYVILSNFRRKGIMYRVCKIVMQYGFDKLSLKKITAYTKDQNSNSINLLHKLGFVDCNSFVKDYRRYEYQPKHSSF